MGANEEVITFENDREYGLASFYTDEDSDQIKYDISRVEKIVGKVNVNHTEVNGMDAYHVGIFIDDASLIEKTNNVKISFADEVEGEPFAISSTLNNSNALIITYKSDDGAREIESVVLSDDNGDVLYEIIQDMNYN